MPRYTTFIFDLDGTLIDSAPAILASFRSAFDAAGRSPARAISADIIGPPLTETLQLLSATTDAAVIDALSAHFKAAYDGDGLKQTTAYAGVDEMLRALHGAGRALHIATNKRLHPTRKILAMLGWDALFTTVYALDMVTPRLPGKAAMIGRQLDEQGLDRHSAAYIGDRLEDGEAAAANDLPFFAATWGYGAIDRNALRPGWVHLPAPDPQRLLAEA